MALNIDRGTTISLMVPSRRPVGFLEIQRQACEASRIAFEQLLLDHNDMIFGPFPRADSLPLQRLEQRSSAIRKWVSHEIGCARGRNADNALQADGSRRRRQLKVKLKGEALEGVSVSVYEDSGKIVADFVCASERSREYLCRMAPALAVQLAEALKRWVCVRVSVDNAECRRLEQTDAPAPQAERHVFHDSQ